MRTLKLPKFVPKYGLKTLHVSTCGGNMRMKMMKVFIIKMMLMHAKVRISSIG
jgi:hypothetical protein